MPTKIEWTDESWNPITGCSPVSRGCEHCWAKRNAQRLRGRAGYPADDPFKITVRQARMVQPIWWRRPRLIFVCGMGDLFHEHVPVAAIEDVFRTMARASHHFFQILTKRPDRMRYILTRPSVTRSGIPWSKEPFPNVWLGVSAEDQDTFNYRVDVLLRIPARLHYVSLEPLVGPMSISSGLPDMCDIHHMYNCCQRDRPSRLRWVIVGGESGPGARPMHPDWVRSIRDECALTGIPFFFKQWGEWAPSVCHFHSKRRLVVIDQSGRPVRSHRQFGIEMVRVGKRTAGHTLDGDVHQALPRGIRRIDISKRDGGST